MSSFFLHRPVVNILRLIWVFTILFYEYGVFIVSVRNCTWPTNPLWTSLSHFKFSKDSAPSPEANSRPYHVLLVGDPQIVDWRSYPNRLAPISYLTRIIVDLNMRKNWRVALRKQPDTIVFLGDVMDNGRLDISDDEYELLFERFKRIFKMQTNIPVYHLPGNHDVGLGRTRSFKVSPKAYERYVTHFGAPNHQISVANHTLVFFDAPKFVEEDLKRHGQRTAVKGWRPIQGGSWAFLKSFSKQKPTDPVILFSHIPLYRPDGKSCGPLRERGTIRPGAGEGYQNTLEKQSTALLLDSVDPVAIFSGDDHDYCEHFHRIQAAEGAVRTIREISVRSFSMVMNVRRPGFQLLSLAPADLRHPSSPSHADTPCLLPDQMQIYLERYLPLVAITILVIFFSTIYGLRHPGGRSQLLFSSMKEDDSIELEDESGSPRGSISPPSTPKSYQPRNYRSLRERGWVMFQAAATRREPSPSSPFPNLVDTVRAYCPRPTSAKYLRRKRLWVRCLRDIRDVAIFPIVVFVVMTWWVLID